MRTLPQPQTFRPFLALVAAALLALGMAITASPTPSGAASADVFTLTFPGAEEFVFSKDPLAVPLSNDSVKAPLIGERYSNGRQAAFSPQTMFGDNAWIEFRHVRTGAVLRVIMTPAYEQKPASTQCVIPTGATLTCELSPDNPRLVTVTAEPGGSELPGTPAPNIVLDTSVNEAGYGALDLQNGTSHRLVLVGASGARELPSLGQGLALEPQQIVKTSWHWLHGGLNEWFDLAIGDTLWMVRVAYHWGDVTCAYKKVGEPDSYYSSYYAASRPAPFQCAPAQGYPLNQINRGTPESQSKFTLQVRGPVTTPNKCSSACPTPITAPKPFAGTLLPPGYHCVQGCAYAPYATPPSPEPRTKLVCLKSRGCFVVPE